MGKIKVELNSEGVREMLKSPEVEKMCMDIANSAVAKLGADYKAEARHYPERTAAVVLPTTYQAKKDAMEHSVILKALGK